MSTVGIVPTHGPEITDAEIDRLAWTVDRDGLAGHEASISRIVARATSSGQTSIAVDVLADPDEPEVARIRALGIVLRRLVHPPARAASPLRHTGRSVAA